ncbi:hypothetical protein QFZ80_003312 [Paenibacillus sp. V4I7]|nr:hypothetical protein [Paenibacillus sp. V4I7]
MSQTLFPSNIAWCKSNQREGERGAMNLVYTEDRIGKRSTYGQGKLPLLNRLQGNW